MSKDILGSLVRALVTVPASRLGLVQDFALKLADEKSGHEWEKSGKDFLRKKPVWVEVEEVNIPPQPFEKIPIISLEDGLRTCTLSVNVDWGQNWQEAINLGGPDTPLDYNIRKVAGEYPPNANGEIGEEFTLLNYSRADGGLEKARAWGEDNGLELVEPRGAFAVGKQYPLLHQQLGSNPMYVVATKTCTFAGGTYAGCVWWRVAEREARLGKVENFGYADDWFLFRKKVLGRSVT